MKPNRVIVPVPAEVALVYDGRGWQLVNVPHGWLDGWDDDVEDIAESHSRATQSGK